VIASPELSVKVESVPIESVHPDPANVRRHPERNLDTIKASLARFGQQTPIVVDSKCVVRKGNGTLAAAKALGWTTIDIVRTDLSGVEATAYAIADNRTAELAEWDGSGLAETLRALQSEEDEGIFEAAGFSEKELEEMLASLGDEMLAAEGFEDDEAPVDKAEELLDKWKVKPGDLWEIPSLTTPNKSHRLLCGDSTKPDHVARVMDGAKAPMMNTDPPYGIDYAASKQGMPVGGFRNIQERFGDIENDDLTNGAELQSFLEAMIRAAVPHLTPNPAFYLWHPMLTQGTFFAAAAAACVRPRSRWHPGPTPSPSAMAGRPASATRLARMVRRPPSMRSARRRRGRPRSP
jgi:ParB-like chromosome segregation protein Spo0J